MSNYTNQNLVNVPASTSLSGVLAIKIGENVFTAGNLNIGTNYYECASVTPSSQAGQSTDIIVTGTYYPAINGTYTLSNPSATGTSRVWVKDSYVICYNSNSVWAIQEGVESYQPIVYIYESIDPYPEDPIGSDFWIGYNEGIGADVVTTWGSAPPTPTENTWTGYKFNLVDGKYVKQSSLTTDKLTFSSVTPVIGKIYTADALCTIKTLYTGFPTEGLKLYIPLESIESTASTGQNITYTGNPSIAEIQGISCVYFNNTNLKISNGIDTPTGNVSWTISMWMKILNGSSDGYQTGAYYGGDSSDVQQGFVVYNNSSKAWYGIRGLQNEIDNIGDDLSWHHYLATYDGSSLKMYKDNVLVGTTSLNISLAGRNLVIGSTTDNKYYIDGYISSYRIYNRVLSYDQIATLASEFTPTND